MVTSITSSKEQLKKLNKKKNSNNNPKNETSSKENPLKSSLTKNPDSTHTTNTTNTNNNTKKTSEIDDIFGSLSKSSKLNSSTIAQHSVKETNNKREHLQQKNGDGNNEYREEEEEPIEDFGELYLDQATVEKKIAEIKKKTQRQPLHVVDFSENGSNNNNNNKKQKKSHPNNNNINHDDGFADSRGLKSSSRKTDDGYNLYTLDDLNIGKGGGRGKLNIFNI